MNKCNGSAVVIAFPSMIWYHSMKQSENVSLHETNHLKIGVPTKMLSLP